MALELGNKKGKKGVLSEIAFYLRTGKRYWLVPMIAVLAFFSLLLVVSQVAPVISPFIYTLF